MITLFTKRRAVCAVHCGKEGGYVFLYNKEVEYISLYLKIEKDKFLKLCTRKVLYGNKTALVDLRIKGEIRCVFLGNDNRCEIYNVRPK